MKLSLRTALQSALLSVMLSAALSVTLGATAPAFAAGTDEYKSLQKVVETFTMTGSVSPNYGS